MGKGDMVKKPKGPFTIKLGGHLSYEQIQQDEEQTQMGTQLPLRVRRDTLHFKSMGCTVFDGDTYL